MKILSRTPDARINSSNLYVETTFKEYLNFARTITSNNELQRKRVKTSKTIYSLLKNDLKKGCIMPPLVLAMSNSHDIDVEKITGNELMEILNKNKSDVLILDGLQRTYTLIDADTEMSRENADDYSEFLNHSLRLEIYVEINKFGILYRMLTLNTGQTPMSSRHQIEMLYRGMLDTDIEGVTLITAVEGKADAAENEFIFKNTIEGFNSYMNRNALPIDRQELLDNIKMLENMSDEDVTKDIFNDFLSTYIKIYNKLRKLSNDHTFSDDELDEYGVSSSPFGKNVSKIFSSSQALTGFGAAAGKMKEKKIINKLSNIVDMLDELESNYENNDWMAEMLIKFDKIKNSSKKIGNAQRMFFEYFFRELFNSDSDSYLCLSDAVENGYNKYVSQVS